MSGFIKKLFTGVLSFLSGLLSGKKSQPSESNSKVLEKPAVSTAKKQKSRGYFMELEEADEGKTLNGNLTSPAAKPAQLKQAKTPEPVAAKAEPQPKPAKTSEPTQAKPAKVELVQTAKGVKVETDKSAKAPVASTNGKSQTETTFAPKYLIPSASSSRRRPGPNMNPFLDMARQVKTSN